MSFVCNDRYIFCAEWIQPESGLSRPIYLYFFVSDGSVELYDKKTKKTHLRRIKVPEIQESDFYLGAKLNFFGRELVIIDYADELTKQQMNARCETTCAIIQPEAINQIGKIFTKLIKNGLKINKCRMMQWTMDEVKAFYGNSEAVTPFHIQNLSSGNIIGMELLSENAVEKFKQLCGPENIEEARNKFPDCLRAEIGQDNLKPGIHCSQSKKHAKHELRYLFSSDCPPFSTTETCGPAVLGIIKPHAIKEGSMGDIISMIQFSGLEITAMKMLSLERANCEEFLEVYKGVVTEYCQMVLQLISGPCLAVEVRAIEGELNTYDIFRNLCGPMDPEIGKQVRPNTIRAKFGTNKVRNAIHCTDLAEDTNLEIEYIFKILK